ncbi:hypothetical protein CMK20_04960 [Candidatus Poribacteria bacterium]|nr:hypothetical protein [Candidatus Poribacteria bacterium]
MKEFKMENFLIITILVLTFFSCSHTEDNLVKTNLTGGDLFTQKLVHDNIDREYTIYLPSSYDDTSTVPLMLGFHGFGDTASTSHIFSDMKPIAEIDGFILVIPQGVSLKGEKEGSHWNHEPNSAKQNKSNVDDLGFVSALIDKMTSEYRVDSKRIYVYGYSNGAFLANSLACYLSNKIAAVASIAGLMSTEIIKSYQPLHPTAVIMFHGTADQVIPYEGIEGYAMSIDQIIDYWIEFNAVNTTPQINIFKNDIIKLKSSSYDKKNGFDDTTIEHYSYRDGKNGVSVENYKIIGGSHWPEINYKGSSISSLIWDFVSKYDIDGLR